MLKFHIDTDILFVDMEFCQLQFEGRPCQHMRTSPHQ